MGQKLCWLVGGRNSNAPAYAPKEQKPKKVPALFLPLKSPTEPIRGDKTVKVG